MVGVTSPIFLVEALGQNRKLSYILHPGKAFIYQFDLFIYQCINLRIPGQIFVRGELNFMILGKLDDIVLIDHDKCR
jgi:hypothetical protein